MGRSRNIFIIYIIMVYCIFALSGCGGPTYEGKELVDKAKMIHTGHDAAHITVSDNATGEVLQEITYRFEGDVMQYMYIGHDSATGEYYMEFNSGNELDTWHTGDDSWSFVAKGNEGYYGYSRISRHYFADGEQLLSDHAAAVKSAEVENEAGGIKIVSLQYDDSKIAQYEQMSGVTGYTQKYFLDNVTDGSGVIVDNGSCYSLAVSYSKDGSDHSYNIDIEYCDPEEPVRRAGLPAVSGEITENGQ